MVSGDNKNFESFKVFTVRVACVCNTKPHTKHIDDAVLGIGKKVRGFNLEISLYAFKDSIEQQGSGFLPIVLKTGIILFI